MLIEVEVYVRTYCDFIPILICNFLKARLINIIMSGGFDALGLMPELLQSIAEQGYLLPTDIQDEAIPLILGV